MRIYSFIKLLEDDGIIISDESADDNSAFVELFREALLSVLSAAVQKMKLM